MPPLRSLRPPLPIHCFCTYCLALTRSSFETGQTITTTTTNTSDCALCAFLQDTTAATSFTITAPKSIPIDEAEQLELDAIPLYCRYKPPYTAFTTSSNPATTLYVREHVLGTSKGTISSTVLGSRIPDCLKSSGIVTEWADLELARSWLQECLAGVTGPHSRCTTVDTKNTMISDPLHPSTRFINVTEGRLEQLQDMAQPPDYIALSYVWGAATTSYHLRTLRSNVTDFCQGFNVRIPMTIRDAMAVTAELGYKYIWVDALCIVQDDPAEVGVQIRQMNKVYDYAVVTILAAGAPNADHGIPGISIPRTASGPEIKLPQGLAVGLWHEVDETGEEIYDTRGWTLQERLLSRRKLEFDKNRMVFECVRGASEESGRPTEAERLSTFRTENPEPTVPGVVTGPVLQDVAWQDIKADFSKRNLFKLEDRLNAILGVTAALEVTNPVDVYVCAHNQEKLYGDLLWQTERDRDPEETQETMALPEPDSDLFGALEPEPEPDCPLEEDDTFFSPRRFESKPHILSKPLPPLSRSNGLFPTWSWLNIWPIRYTRAFHPLPNTTLLVQVCSIGGGEGWELVIEAPVVTFYSGCFNTQDGQGLSHAFFDEERVVEEEEEIECVAIAEVSPTSWLTGPTAAGPGLWDTYVGALLLKKKDGLNHVRVGMGLASHSLFEGNGRNKRIICR